MEILIFILTILGLNGGTTDGSAYDPKVVSQNQTEIMNYYSQNKSAIMTQFGRSEVAEFLQLMKANNGSTSNGGGGTSAGN